MLRFILFKFYSYLLNLHLFNKIFFFFVFFRYQNHDIPWGKVFTSLSVYALIFAHFGQNFGYFMLLTELPTYLKEALHFDIKANGLISSLPYLVQAFTSWISSYISDRIVKTDKYPLSWVRKGFNSIGRFCFENFFVYFTSFTVISLVSIEFRY